MTGVFDKIYQTNAWGGVSRSGPGSSMQQTAEVRRALPQLLRELDVSLMLDVPCGDLHWMSHVELPCGYIGADVVEDIVLSNLERHASPRRKFMRLDARVDPLPLVDLILCRDMLVHFPLGDVSQTLRNMRDSGATWLLTTTFPLRTTNPDITLGEWRPLNLEAPPFNLPRPMMVINENCTEGGALYADKSLALWRLADVA